MLRSNLRLLCGNHFTIKPNEEPPTPNSEEETGCPECFAAGTPVRTDYGNVPIEEIHVDDRVLSRNRETGALEYERVSDLIPGHPGELVDIRVEGETDPLRPSIFHPFWVKRGDGAPAWIAAGEMRVGDLLQTVKGERKRVAAITAERKSQTVYNFTVAKDHDYFVGETGFLVHNARCRCTVFGRKTGKFYEGISGLAGRQEIISPFLLQLAGLFGGIGAEVPGAAPVGSCAEFDGANQALNDGNELGDLEFGPADIGGVPKPPCAVCQRLFGLVP